MGVGGVCFYSMKSFTSDHDLRRIVRLVAFLNLAYFGIEFAVARLIGSVSLFADRGDAIERAENLAKRTNGER
jgi:Co/Zn/Cd efflux system component